MKIFYIKWVISFIGNLSGMWAAIEFLLYLFKEHQFNWWSVYILVTSLVLALLTDILIIKNWLK